MEKKNLYREYFPGYMGHIPFKYEVIGMTVGATQKNQTISKPSSLLSERTTPTTTRDTLMKKWPRGTN